MIEHKCPHCGSLLQIPNRFAGKSGVCKECGKSVVVPPLNNEWKSSNSPEWIQARDPDSFVYAAKDEVKKRLVEYKCPRCGHESKTAMDSAGMIETCSKCGVAILLPASTRTEQMEIVEGVILIAGSFLVNIGRPFSNFGRAIDLPIT